MAKKAKRSTARKVAKGKKVVDKTNGQLLKAAREALPRLKAGKTTLSAERDRLGLSSNGPLRKALTKVLGGKAAYQKMMRAAQAARPESKSARKGKSAPSAALDDSDVPHQKGGKGWVQIGAVGKGGTERAMFRDPEGNEWAVARPDEPAELIVVNKTNGLTPTRLYKLKPAKKAKRSVPKQKRTSIKKAA